MIVNGFMAGNTLLVLFGFLVAILIPAGTIEVSIEMQ